MSLGGKLNINGKILFYGGYSITIGGIGLSIAVLDGKGEGVKVYYKKGKARIISPQFSLDFSPTLKSMQK